MKHALMVIALAVVGVLAVKASSRRSSGPAVVAVAAAPIATSGRPSVVLVADPREADAQCPCGEIIRRARAPWTA